MNDSDQCFSGNNFVFTNNSSITVGTLSYNWQFGDGGSSTATSPSKSYTASGSFSVLLIGTTDKGCVDTARKPVRVYATPKADYQLTTINPQCFRGNRFVFSNKSISIDGSMTYRWTFGDGSSSTTGNPTISYSATGDYPVKLVTTSSFGCKDSFSQTMSVKANPKSFFTVNDSDQCLSGNLYTFKNLSGITAGVIANRLWSYGDGSNSTLLSPNKTYTNRGSYTISLISISDWGCRDTFRKNVRVYGGSNISFVVNNSDQCLKGNRFVFTNNSSASDGTLSYQWTFGEGGKSSLAAPIYTYSNPGAFLVKVVGTSSFGCKDSGTANLNVWPQGKPSFKANDSDQCFRNNSFVFANNSTISSGALAFLWSFGDGSTTTITNPVKTYSNFGTWQVALVSVSDKGCRDTIKKPVRVYAMPSAGFVVNPNNACLKGNLFVSANTGSIAEGTFTTNWKNGDGSVFAGSGNIHTYSNPGNYVVWQILNSNFGCVDSTSKQVVVHPMPKAMFTVSPADLCEGEPVYSSNQSNISSGTIQYTWSFGNGYFKNGDTASSQYGKYGNYPITLVANSDKGCKDSASYNMKVSSVPVASFTALPNPACAKQSVIVFNNLSSNADGKPINSVWQFGDGGTSILSNPTHIYLDSGKYKPLLTVNNGKCKDTSIGVVSIVPSVSAAFTTLLINKETRGFYAKDTTEPGYVYVWSYGDSTQGSGAKSRHMYGENGSFTAKLYVENSLGCRDSSTQTIEILSPNYIDQNNGASFYVYPNPNSGLFTYKFKITQKQTVEVKLYDIVGHTVLYTATWENAEPGNYFQSVDLKKLQLSKGTYPLVVYANGEQYVVKVIYVGD
jgi:PKD repeat protein